MTLTNLEIIILIDAIVIIVSVLLQKHKTVGFMTNAADSQDIHKRGFELFLYRVTGVASFIFFALAIYNLFQ